MVFIADGALPARRSRPPVARGGVGGTAARAGGRASERLVVERRALDHGIDLAARRDAKAVSLQSVLGNREGGEGVIGALHELEREPATFSLEAVASFSEGRSVVAPGAALLARRHQGGVLSENSREGWPVTS
jgi:hypothetical protein